MRLGWLAALLLWSLPLPAQVLPLPVDASEVEAIRTQPGTGIEIEVISPLSKLPPGGYLPLLVHVRNRSSTDASYLLTANATLNFDADTGTRRLEQTFSVASGQTRIVEILLPLPGGSAYTLRGSDQIFVDGYLSGDGIIGRSHFSFVGSYGTGRNRFGSRFDDGGRRLGVVGVHQSLYSFYNYQNVLNDFDQTAVVLNLGMLFEDWRAYLGFSHVLLQDHEWEALRPAQRTALLHWVSTGGRLHLLAPLNDTQTLSGLGTGPDGRLPKALPRGLGAVHLFNGELKSSFERFEILVGGSPQMRVEPNFFNVRSNLSQPPLPIRLEHDNLPMGLLSTLPRITTSITLVCMVAVLFALAVGPLNLFMLARGKKRHRIFVYTPVFSIGATVVVLLAILLGDGTGGNGQRATLLVQVDGENQLVALREQGSQTGLLFEDTFALPADTAVFPLHAGGDTHYADPRFGATFNRVNDRHEGDWFANRSQQAMALAGLIASRAKIRLLEAPPVSASGGNLRLESSINATCLEIYVMHVHSERQWRAENVGPGTSVEATPITQQQFHAFVEAQGRQFSSELNQALLSRLHREHSPEQWVVLARLNGFDELDWQTHPAIDWEERITLFVGQAEAPQ
ncbi:MAG: hypothetical protein ACFB20_07695 [Opitutales bacterium]